MILQLQREYDRIMPPLKELDKKARERGSKQDAGNQGLGTSQAFEYGQRSIEERVRLEGLEKQTLMLAEKLSLDVGSPPSYAAGQQDSLASNALSNMSDSLS